MKNYVKPSIELTKFDVEDIITVSGAVNPGNPGVVGGEAALSTDAAAIYNAAGIAAGEKATNFVEFQW